MVFIIRCNEHFSNISVLIKISVIPIPFSSLKVELMNESEQVCLTILSQVEFILKQIEQP
jgi:hypothetical protein